MKENEDDVVFIHNCMRTQKSCCGKTKDWLGTRRRCSNNIGPPAGWMWTHIHILVITTISVVQERRFLCGTRSRRSWAGVRLWMSCESSTNSGNRTNDTIIVFTIHCWYRQQGVIACEMTDCRNRSGSGIAIIIVYVVCCGGGTTSRRTCSHSSCRGRSRMRKKWTSAVDDNQTRAGLAAV